MSSFYRSSHSCEWLISQNDLESLRRSSDGLGDENTIRTLPENVSAWASEGKRKISTIDDEEIALIRYSGIIQVSMGAAGNAPIKGVERKHWRVAATSITYFRRFYLNNSLLSYDPRLIMVACLYLAGKVEESRVGFPELQNIHKKCTLEALRESEQILIQALKFQLKVYHPNSLINTLIADHARVLSVSSSLTSDAPAAVRKDWRVRADTLLGVLQRSSACLCFTALEIAVCVLALTEPQDKNTYGSSTSSSLVEAILKTLPAPFNAPSPSTAADLVPPASTARIGFHVYLEERFGASAVTAFEGRYSKIAKLINSVLEADSRDEDFKEFMSRAKKQAKWGSTRSGGAVTAASDGAVTAASDGGTDTSLQKTRRKRNADAAQLG